MLHFWVSCFPCFLFHTNLHPSTSLNDVALSIPFHKKDSISFCLISVVERILHATRISKEIICLEKDSRLRIVKNRFTKQTN
uniref:Putative secreted protein n=1 Tax=Anopheles darlingi TaxID=43151 RepID=A0A2M4DLC2_ANODA